MDDLKLELYGMIHLPPLPGSPGYKGVDVEDIVEYAVSEAYKLYNAGFDGLMVENYMDYPFNKYSVSPMQIEAIDRVVNRISRVFRDKLSIGLNILRNAGRQSIELACKYKLDFIRVNSYMEPIWAPEGLIEPIAPEIWSVKKRGGCNTMIYADVNVKHSKPILPYIIALKNTISRGRVDGVIISGEETGGETPVSLIYLARKASRGRTKVIVGSGVNHHNIGLYIGVADAVIVGTSIKENRVTEKPIDEGRARELVAIRDKIIDRMKKYY